MHFLLPLSCLVSLKYRQNVTFLFCPVLPTMGPRNKINSKTITSCIAMLVMTAANIWSCKKNTGLLLWKMSQHYSGLYCRNLGWSLPARCRLLIQSRDTETAVQLLFEVFVFLVLCSMLRASVHDSLRVQGSELCTFTDMQAQVAQTQLN
jgi:hypothetical protein